jgi:hypothetical protein
LRIIKTDLMLPFLVYFLFSKANVHRVACLLEASIEKSAETAVAMEWLCKRLLLGDGSLAATNMHTLGELLEAVFSVQSELRLSVESCRGKLVAKAGDSLGT